MTFTAIDFETATGYRHSACAIGLVRVENGEIADTFTALIRPPDNEYWSRNVCVHGISARHTKACPSFEKLLPEFKHFVEGRRLVAHNASFDRSVLMKTMEHYNLSYQSLNVSEWACTLNIYRAKGFRPCRLSDCCRKLDIQLNHHEALSDALACAHLYLRS